MKVINSFYF